MKLVRSKCKSLGNKVWSSGPAQKWGMKTEVLPYNPLQYGLSILFQQEEYFRITSPVNVAIATSSTIPVLYTLLEYINLFNNYFQW